MKIGFDAKRAFFNFTGLGNYARTLLSDLSAYQPDLEYSLFTPRINRNDEIMAFLSEIKADVISPSHPFHRIWRQFGIPGSAKKRNVDLFHGLSHELPTGLRSKNIRSVVTMHDIIYRLYPEYYTNTDRKIYASKTKSACKQADGIIAISESTKKDLVREFNVDEEKVVVIHQSCAKNYREFHKNKDKSYDVRPKYELPQKFILYVGSVIERKKLLETVQAIEKVNKELSLPLVVIGKGREYMRRVAAYVSENELEDVVLFRSNVTNDDMPYIYNQAEMLIYPSEYEGFGIPVLESLYCNTPVISSNLASLPEVGGDISHYLEEITAEAIAKKVFKIIDNKRSPEENWKIYSTHLDRFDPEKICKEHIDFYKKILA